MHPYFAFARDSLGAECADESIEPTPCRRVLMGSVGSRPAQPILSQEEVRQHIDDLTVHFLDAYARFERYGLPADREEAVRWLQMRDAAIRERMQAARLARAAFGAVAGASKDGAGFFDSEQAQAIGGVR
jgi:hypothetical protein